MILTIWNHWFSFTINAADQQIINQYIESGQYFTINRARQYGKTTLLYLLEKELRKQVKVLKSQYSLEQKVEMSRPLWKELEQTDFFKEARTVLLYWSMDDEVFTHDYVCKWAGEKTVLLPCVKGDVLELRVFKGMESLQPGEAFGILEPVGELYTDYDAIDLIVVPGVAFDRHGNRLGRGRGYYDKILKETHVARKVGICFGFQFVEEVPVDELDVRMDLVIHGI